MATTDATGAQTGTFTYDPFGNPVATSPNNTASGSTYGWVGQHEKDTETAFALAPTEMGARVYLAKLGRFLQVDPEEGGNENNYTYPPDPVNNFDLDGNAGFNWKAAVSIVTKVASVGAMIPGPIGITCSAVAVAGNIAQGHYREAAIAAVGLVGVGGVAAVGVKLASKAGVGAKLAARLMGPLRSEAGHIGLPGGASRQAAALGFTKRIAAHKLPFDSRGQAGFQKGRRIITLDVDSHKGGYWKVFQIGRGRIGTYNADLTRRIGR